MGLVNLFVLSLHPLSSTALAMCARCLSSYPNHEPHFVNVLLRVGLIGLVFQVTEDACDVFLKPPVPLRHGSLAGV